MSCLSPHIIRSKARDAKHGSVEYVPCHHCTGCLQDDQNASVYRIECEDSVSKHSLFVTLTYAPERVPLRYTDTGDLTDYQHYIANKELRDVVMSVNYDDGSKYWKRVRKALPDFDGKFYMNYEYGDQFDRPHMHYVLFYNNYDPSIVEYVLREKWQEYGSLDFQPLIPERIDYVTKDISKKKNEAPPSEYSLPCKHTISNNFGDFGFMNDLRRYQKNQKILDSFYSKRGEFDKIPPEMPEYVSLRSGVKIPVPRYFREKYYVKKDYLLENVYESDSKRFKKNQKEFDRIRQDLLVKGYEPTLEKITNAFSSDHDVERIRRDYVLSRYKRKGLSCVLKS